MGSSFPADNAGPSRTGKSLRQESAKRAIEEGFPIVEINRLAERPTASGKPLREELLSHYKTECPACGNPDADIIYVFWVKSAICTDAKCRKQVPLFPNYLVA